MWKKFIFLGMVLLVIGSDALAQTQMQLFEIEGYPKFSVDYAGFMGNEEASYLEVYTQISFKDLHFVKQGDHFVARYELEVSVLDDDELIRQRTFVDTVRVYDFERTLSSQEYRLTTQGFLLKPGPYQVQVILQDQETHRAVSQKMPVTLRDFSTGALNISDLELARKIDICQDQTSAFVKNGRFVEPNASCAFGYLTTNIYLYYEIYGLTPPADAQNDEILVNYMISTVDGAIKKRIQRKTRKPGASCVHSVLMPVADLASGTYVLEVEARDSQKDEVARVRKQFVIGWDMLPYSEETSEEMLEQLKYIATEQEIDRMKGLPRPFRRAAILSFWKSRDPSPGTEVNELMLEFYRRVAYVNRKFQTQEQKGWQTDQGRIYIQYGPPDSIHRFFKAEKGQPYEIWRYNHPRKRFVFIGKKGWGIFKLYTAALPADFEN